MSGDGSKGTVISEHREGEGFRLPMLFTVIDQSGEAEAVIFGDSGKLTWH